MAGKTTKTATTKDETAGVDSTGADSNIADVALGAASDTASGADGGGSSETGENASGSDADAAGADPDHTGPGNSENGTTVPAGVNVLERKAVVFLGPHHRYSRGDKAWFDSQYAETLVERNIAAWPKDAKRALAPRPGDHDFDTDIG